jgi:hypothetical protein
VTCISDYCANSLHGLLKCYLVSRTDLNTCIGLVKLYMFSIQAAKTPQSSMGPSNLYIATGINFEIFECRILDLR